MKNLFAKKILLLGAAAMLLNVVPAHAMEEAAVQEEVATKTGFFSGWSNEALRKKLDSNMKFLNEQWKGLMKCLKGDKDCPRGQILAVRSTLATILAIVGALTVAGTAYGLRRGIRPKATPFTGKWQEQESVEEEDLPEVEE